MQLHAKAALLAGLYVLEGRVLAYVFERRIIYGLQCVSSICCLLTNVLVSGTHHVLAACVI